MQLRSPVVFLTLSLFAPRLEALDTVACTEAHFEAQVARSEGRLLDAEEQLSLCGDRSCPGVLTAECGEWLADVSREIPSIVVVVQDVRERDVIDFNLSIDGQQVTPNSLGAVRLDPGKHEIVVSAEGFVQRHQMIRLRVGEQHRRVRLLLADAEPEESSQAPVWPLALAGTLAVAGGAGFVYFGLNARDSERELEECSPNCSESAVSAVRSEYVAANVSLGVGLAALAAGGLYFFLRPKSDSSARVGVDVPHGAPSLTFSGKF